MACLWYCNLDMEMSMTRWFPVVFLLLACGGFCADEKVLREKLEQGFPDAEIGRISVSVIPGIYQFLVGTEVLYVTEDGRYVFSGDIYDMNDGKRNLSEVVREQSRKARLSEIPADEYIEFAPSNPAYHIYVFTDIDCGYCRKLHNDVAELNRMGIAVRYLAYPRTGLSSQTARKMRHVWCSPQRMQAITAAKRGQSVQPAQCKDPVRKQYLLGGVLGVSGTPSIFFEDGGNLPGYRPPHQLLEILQTR